MCERFWGGLLRSRTAAGGTAWLTVDHERVDYCLDVQWGAKKSDVIELVRYLSNHDFEVVPADECEPELLEGPLGIPFYRWVVCSKTGEEYSTIRREEIA